MQLLCMYIYTLCLVPELDVTQSLITKSMKAHHYIYCVCVSMPGKEKKNPFLLHRIMDACEDVVD